MTEKIGRISNPLTVIAIFAGISEISGTVVLPLLEKKIQYIFIWFVMLFPVLLVGGFFFILWKKHDVLYAPSDYKEDKSFLASIKRTTISDNSVENSQPESGEITIDFNN